MTRSRHTPDELASLSAAARSLLARVLLLARSTSAERAHRGVVEAAFHVELARLALDPSGEAEAAQIADEEDAHANEVGSRGEPRPRAGTAEPRQRPDGDEVASLVRSRNAALHGSSSVIALPELVGLLQVNQKSGHLRIRTPSETIVMAFDRGHLAYAHSDNAPAGTRLGEILVAQNALRAGELAAFLERHSRDRGKLGEALQRGELVNAEQLRAAIEHQAHQIFLRAQESEATYAFTPGEPEAWGHSVKLNVVHLMLECARLQDEAGAPGSLLDMD